MKTALYGRIVFGASAVLFGVIALMWHGSGAWHLTSHKRTSGAPAKFHFSGKRGDQELA
jgi:hypothetical protein